MWHSPQASRTTFPNVSLFTKDDGFAKSAPFAVFSYVYVFDLSVPLPPQVLLGFTLEANISLEADFGQIVFLSALFVGFHSEYQST